jgi:hypothetical protein
MAATKSAQQPRYQIMADQPDCCGKCGRRLELVNATYIDGERVFLSHCGCCQHDVLIVED